MSQNYKPPHTPALKPVVHQMVLNAPSGLDAHEIAPLAGYGGNGNSPYITMLAELSQDRKCDLNRLLPLMQLADSDAPMHFLARHRNGVFFRLPEPAAGAHTLVSALAESIWEFGEYATATAAHISDGKIPFGELVRIEKEGFEAMGAVMAMINLARVTHARQFGGV